MKGVFMKNDNQLECLTDRRSIHVKIYLTRIHTILDWNGIFEQWKLSFNFVRIYVNCT